jgi:predicted CXXCH cytochrome family protein
MKKSLYIILALAFGLFLGVGQTIAQTGIANSAHDFVDGVGFDNDNWAIAAATICSACHTPHNAGGSTLLWNHEESGVAYANNINTVFGTTWGTPDGTSILCLSCHDGTVALENFGGTTTGTTQLTANLQIGDGATLADNHPISLDYDDTAGGGSEFVDEATVDASNIRLYGSAGNFRIQCGSCHDVHNKASVAGTALLRLDGTQICQACHDK